MRQGMALPDLAAELERQRDAKHDFVADTRRMHFTATPTADPSPARERYGAAHVELDLIGDGADEGATGMHVTAHAQQQMATHLGIPWRYFQRLRDTGELNDLLGLNVNRLLHHTPERRMVRELDGKARAFLSDRYRRLDNVDLAATVLPIIGEIPDVEIVSCDLTEKRMYIKAVTPRVSGEVKVGEEVQAGVFVSNSEVGSGRLRVEPFVMTLACRNGMVVPKALGAAAMRRVHVGRRLDSDDETYSVFTDETLKADDHAFFLACGDVVRAAVDEVRFRDLLKVMQAAANSAQVQDVIGAVQHLAKAESLEDNEVNSVLTHLAAGGDLSQWGVLSAVTRTAEDVEDYDRASELEELGGAILAYTPREWDAVATAQAS
jgi:hypothetical protein